MVYTIFTVLLAAFGLGFLVFIHELGHYFMARRVGMKVEAFGIGFGKPLLTWERNGVKWHLCTLPFGGYVRIAGMEKKGSLEPHQIPDGFYGKTPGQRVLVALMGPIVNIVFALAAFAAIWALGGRQRPFSEYTQTIGWVDPQSKTYAEGMRAGDRILELDGKPFAGFKEILYHVVLGDKSLRLQGTKPNYQTGGAIPFDKQVDIDGIEKMSLAPAQFLVSRELVEGSPMKEAGMQEGDRIVWVDGERIFSAQQLFAQVNDSRAFLTVMRGKERLLVRAPRLRVADLKGDPSLRAELSDWQHAARLKGRVGQLFFIPYNLSNAGVVEQTLSYLDENSQESKGHDLHVGDRIIAVDGLPVASGAELLAQLQKRHVQLIVQRGPMHALTWKDADRYLQTAAKSSDLDKLIGAIGAPQPAQTSGNLVLLSPATPKPLSDFAVSQTALAKEEEIGNLEKVKSGLALVGNSQRKLGLGVKLSDAPVNYNPSPFVLFGDVCAETWQTLVALVTGLLSPKWMTGPVGIVQVMQYGWSQGVTEALFWMAVISLNLGLLNLLPVPVLDGGHICFSIYEATTKKRIKAKVMERMIIPFIVLLVAFFLFVTYHDIMRLIGRFF